MPILGYGVYQVTPDECERCVLDALERANGRGTQEARRTEGAEEMVIQH